MRHISSPLVFSPLFAHINGFLVAAKNHLVVAKTYKIPNPWKIINKILKMTNIFNIAIHAKKIDKIHKVGTCSNCE